MMYHTRKEKKKEKEKKKKKKKKQLKISQRQSHPQVGLKEEEKKNIEGKQVMELMEPLPTGKEGESWQEL